MNWWTKIFGEPDDWRFVGKVDNKYQSGGYPKESHILSYYLYENQHGKRKFDVIDTDPERGDINVKKLSKTDWVFRNKDYRHTVHPWFTGFRNPDFPTYETAPQHDFKRLLEGGSK